MSDVFLSKALKQFATYWPPVGTDAEGNPIPGSPITVKVRWTVTQRLSQAPTSEDLHEGSPTMVDRDVALGGYMRLGVLSSGDSVNPADYQDSLKIVGFDKVPSFKATKFVRTVTFGG